MSFKIDALKLDDLQREKGLTGIQLAQKAGLGQQGFSRIKTHQACRLISAQRIARALGVDLKAIQREENEIPTSKD